jgi:hypothetical protein
MRRHGEAGVERLGGEEAVARAIEARVDAGEEVPALVDAIADAL